MSVKFDYKLMKGMIDAGAVEVAKEYFSKNRDELSFNQKRGIWRKLNNDYHPNSKVRDHPIFNDSSDSLDGGIDCLLDFVVFLNPKIRSQSA